MIQPAPPFREGDRVRTNQRVHRLPAGSIGTITRVYGDGVLLDVLFVGNRAPQFMYPEQLEVLSPQAEGNE
jgi:hypothetical protein